MCLGTSARESTVRYRANLPSSRRAEIREHIRHLESCAHGFGTLVVAGLGLVGAIKREHTESDRNPCLDRGELQPGGSL